MILVHSKKLDLEKVSVPRKRIFLGQKPTVKIRDLRKKKKLPNKAIKPTPKTRKIDRYEAERLAQAFQFNRLDDILSVSISRMHTMSDLIEKSSIELLEFILLNYPECPINHEIKHELLIRKIQDEKFDQEL